MPNLLAGLGSQGKQRDMATRCSAAVHIRTRLFFKRRPKIEVESRHAGPPDLHFRLFLGMN